MRRVSLTGLGTCGAYGVGRAALAKALADGRGRVTELDRSRGFHREGGARQAHLLDQAELVPWLPGRSARRMSPASRMAVAALRMALEDAGLAEADGAAAVERSATAISLGTPFGTSFAQDMIDQVFERGPTGAAPFLFIDSGANAPAGQLAVAVGAEGPNLTVMQFQASALMAVINGMLLIQSGRCERVFAGAVNEMVPLLHSALDRFGALAHPPDGAPERSLPFGSERRGFVAADGATVFVLESEACAARRGAAALAHVVAGVRANDPSAPSVGWGEGAEGLGAALTRGLERQGIAPESLDRIVSGASGSVTGDRLEARVLSQLWPAGSHPTLLTPKSLCGEYGGGFLGAAALSLGAGAHRAGCDWPVDETLEVSPHAGGPLDASGRTLCSTLSAGGSAAWLVLEHPEFA